MAKRKERTNIVIAGRVNAGKSSLLNLLSGQKDFAIVDATPGTTADTVKAIMEIHDFGPVKVFDTAGVDEVSELGNKKRRKTFEAVDEGDLVLLVVGERSLDSRSLARDDKNAFCRDDKNAFCRDDRKALGRDDRKALGRDDSFKQEMEIIERAKKRGKQLLTVYNIFKKGKMDFSTRPALQALAVMTKNIPYISIDVSDFNQQRKLIEFIKSHYIKKPQNVELLPFLKETGFVLLNIPMDEETPQLRLLRPQDMALERLLRKFFTPVLYRMDLKKAREEEGRDFSTPPSTSSGSTRNDKEMCCPIEMTNRKDSRLRGNDNDIRANDCEKNRFLETISHLNNSKEGLKLIITDSQAMDVISKWVPENIPLTTFSIMMTDYMSNGNLKLFVDGLKVIPALKNGDFILIAEACNHDRKAEDIGTVQIPKIFKEKLGLKINFEYSAGRVFPNEKDLNKYKLIIHCGGCMIDKQKYMARIATLKEYNIPVTNYGVILSYFQGEKALEKVLEPWKIYAKINSNLK